MKHLALVFFVLLFISCHKSDCVDTTVPECIQSIIDDEELSADLRTVRVQKVDNQLHYWLNTDYVHFDGAEEIVNSACDTICYICGECIPPDCYYDYDYDDWMVIWEK